MLRRPKLFCPDITPQQRPPLFQIGSWQSPATEGHPNHSGARSICPTWILHENIFLFHNSSPRAIGPLLQLLLLTAQRRGEVTNIRRSKIDFARAVWTIPAENAKNGRAHEVPMCEMALQILREIPHFVGSDIVFTTTGATMPEWSSCRRACRPSRASFCYPICNPRQKILAHPR
jgi:hypothetical protein